MTHVTVCEVSPRDGLQNEKRVLPPARRAELVDLLAACGFERVEAVSFVNPARVPQMADAEEVLRLVRRRPGVAYTGLALNPRGARRAVAAGVDRINVALVATDTFNQRNQGKATAGSLRDLAGIVELAAAAGVPCTATVGAAFGCPFEGPVPPARVAELAEAAAGAGADEVVLSDTIGVGVPTQVVDLVGAVRERVGPDLPLGCHFHHTRNTGLANAVAAVQHGVTLLDASAGGAGGCPFAPAATGNIPTEDLLYLLRGMGYRVPVDLPAVLPVVRWLEGELGHRLPGMLARAGLDWHPGAS